MFGYGPCLTFQQISPNDHNDDVDEQDTEAEADACNSSTAETGRLLLVFGGQCFDLRVRASKLL